MNIPLLGSIDLSDWLRGLIGGFVAGGASAVTSGPTLALVDPAHFNLHSGDFYVAVGSIFMANGVIGMMLFLAQHPVPGVKTTTITAQETKITPAGATTETRLQQTVTEPVPVTPAEKESK